MSPYDIVHRFVSQSYSVEFQYLHPLSAPYYSELGEKLISGSMRPVRADNILCFGMMEYTPVVHGAGKVVYDPQGSTENLFSSAGSTARELIYVLNERELQSLTGTDDLQAAGEALLQRESNTIAVILKRGPLGLTVFQPGRSEDLPAYRARRVFKIGSGDIFAAAFAYFWMIGGDSIEIAADLASRCAACYVETQDAYIPEKNELLRDFNNPVIGSPGSIYLASPFFSLEQRWLVEESKNLLEGFGCRVFSPLHEVGTGKTNQIIATEDLVGLDRSNAVIALINDGDTGTVFEIGYGIARKKPVVVYAERNNARDLTMLDGTGCLVFPDYCSAIYNAVWESGVS